MNALVLDAIGSIADFVLKYAITLAALGALSMALLEAWKKLFSVQARFHEQALGDWLRQGTGDDGGDSGWLRAWSMGAKRQYDVARAAPAAGGEFEPEYRWDACRAELLHLTTGLPLERVPRGPADRPTRSGRHVSKALFELDLSRMMAQIQDAADAALNNPDRYPNLFAFLTRGCRADDRDEWLTAMADRAQRRLAEADPERARLIADVYGRIRLLLKRQLDSFQTVTMYRWREFNQAWSITLGAVLMFVAQLIVMLEEAGGTLAATTPTMFLKMLFVSFLGGVLAPVAKDLVDALGRVKRSG